MTYAKTALLAGAFSLVAGGAMATTATFDFQDFASGSTTVDYSAKGSDFSKSGSALAGAFEFLNESVSPAETFIAWCIDILTNLNAGDVLYETNVSILGAAELGRLQNLFDANYEGDTAANGVNSAAFQVAVWNSIYDTDADAGAFGSATAGFKLTGPSSVISKANEYLLAAAGYAGPQRWVIAQHRDVTPKSQDLITVSAIPAPLGALLIGTAVLGAAAVSARRRRRAT